MSSVTLFCERPENADLHKVKKKLILWSFRGKYCTIKDGHQRFNFIADKSGVSVILKVF